MRPAELHSLSAEENCLPANVASLRSVKVATPPCTAKAAIPCGLAVRKLEGLGANPTVVSFGELYSALQTGVVDGAEQPIANYKSNAFPEVANNLILDGHTLGAIQAVITDNAWGKLTENQQAAIMEAGADTQAFNAELSETAENKVLDELKASGCNVVDVPDKAPWQEACAKVISENTSDQAELYQQLLDMKG